jgi:hypothetical protein
VDVAATLSGAHGRPADHTVRRLRPDLDDAQVAEAAALTRPWAVVTSADARLAAAWPASPRRCW